MTVAALPEGAQSLLTARWSADVRASFLERNET